MLKLCLVICIIFIIALVVIVFLLKSKINKLKKSKEEIQTNSSSNIEFLSSANYHIRTSLNTIVGFSECIKQEEDIEICKDNADDIIYASQNLLDIINTVLDISKIQSNKMEIIETEYKPLEIFEKVEKQLKNKLFEKNILLKTNYESNIPYILFGDSDKLEQIVANLLKNAINNTDKDEIKFNVNCSNEKNISNLIISVEYNGVGIKEEDIDKIFNKLELLNNEKITTLEDTNLDLIITKCLVDIIGGKISIESKYGQYLKFTVQVSQQIKMQSTPLITEITKLEESIKPKTYDFSSKKILVVDDNKINLKVAMHLLRPYEIECTGVESGFECLEKIKSGEKFDLIFMDDLMPEMSGIETLKELKNIEGFSTPVIVLTANSISNNKEKYLKAGFKDYLPKPIVKEELNHILENYLTDKMDNMEDTILFTPKSTLKPISKDILDEVKVVDEIEKEVSDNLEEEHSEYKTAEELLNEAEKSIESEYQLEESEHELEEADDENIDEFESDDLEDLDVEDKIESTNDIEEKEDIESGKLDSEVEEDIEFDKLDSDVKEHDLTEDIEDNREDDKYHNRQYLINNGINIENSEQLLGTMSTFDDALTDFMEDARTKLKVIKLFKENSNFNESYSLIRTLKTDVKYLGFDDLYIMLYNFEKKIKEQDSEYLNSNIEDIIKEFERLIDISEEYLGK